MLSHPNYLHHVTERQVREALVEGIEFLRERSQGQVTFEYKQLVGQVARILASEQSMDAARHWEQYQVSLPEPVPGTQRESDDNRKLLSAIWGLIAGGLLFPRLNSLREGYPHALYKLTLTEKGERVLSNASEHPLHPGFISRFRAKAPTASDAVVAHLEDAVSCLENGLLRPSLMMLGLANEETIRACHAALAYEKKVPAAPALAKTRDLLSAIEPVVRGWAGKREEQHRLSLALTAAEEIRVERNDAAHPGKKVTDEPHIEHLLSLVAHHCAIFWEVIVKPATLAGFVIS